MKSDPSRYSLRRSERADALLLATMGADLFVETFGHLYSSRNLNAFLKKAFSEASILHDMDHGRVIWIAEEVATSTWVGFCKFGPVGLPIDVENRTAVELKQLYVRKEHHGTGISHRLMNEFLTWASAQKALDAYVGCWSENGRGLAFYKKYGFEVIGRYSFFVGDHEDDERILRKRLEFSPTGD